LHIGLIATGSYYFGWYSGYLAASHKLY